MQCTNHLKQIGRAVHNHQDAQQTLPPLSVWRHKPGLHLFLTPYIEAQSIWDYVNERAIFTAQGAATKTLTYNGANYNVPNYPYFPDCTTGSGCMLNLPEGIRNGFSVAAFLCPSSGQQSINAYGPISTYAAPLVDPPSADWWRMFCRTLDAAKDSPFQPATITATYNGTMTGDLTHNNIKEWKPSNDMSSWSDGTSNQVIFAEKTVPSWAIELSRSTGQSNACSWDGSYLMSWNDWRQTGGVARIVTTNAAIIAKNPDVIADNTVCPRDVNGVNFWGSHHPASFNALLGDGSVHGLSKTMSPTIFYYYCKTADGNAVALP
jgi:hypothetical protein